MKTAEEIVKEMKFAPLIIPLKGPHQDLVFDIEANNLLTKVTKTYVIVCQDYRTREFYIFSDLRTYEFPCHGNFREGVKFLTRARSIIAHNVSGYDWWTLNKFHPDVFNKQTMPWKNTHDTLTQSKAQWYDRPARKGIKGCHGLAYYGDMLGYPKPPIDDWSFWDRDKLVRCLVDVEINTRTLEYLNKEKANRKQMGIDFQWQTNIAKYTQYWCALQELNGMKADVPLMWKHKETLDVDIEELRSEVEPQLPLKQRVKSSKETWESVNEKMGRPWKRVPATKTEKARRNGEIVDVDIKPAYMPTTKWRTAPMSVAQRPKALVEGKWHKKPDKNGDFQYTKRVADHFSIDVNPVWTGQLIQGDFTPVDLEKMYGWSYDSHTAKWFDIPIDPRESGCVVEGNYTKVYYEEVKMTQHAEIKEFLLSLGWEPTEWNNKKDIHGQYMKDDNGAFVKGSPKLTEDSFESLPPGIGEKIGKYNTLMHRRRTFLNDKDDEKGWLNQLNDKGRIHAGANVFSTATSRHSQNGIVNCPSPFAVFGAPMREVWIAEEGHDLISVDMDSAQLMILAGYMNDAAFTKAVRDGKEVEELDYDPGEGNYFEKTTDGKYKVYVGSDPHTLNSIYFTLNNQKDVDDARLTQDPKLVHKVTGGRKKAKNGIYALLFGSGDSKFARTVGLRTAADGKRIKEAYMKRLPGLKAVITRLEKQFDAHRVGSGGYIQVAGGVWLYCTSKHKLLNYLLMGSEAQLQNVAIIWKCSTYEKEGIPCKQVLTIHDEQTDECPKEFTSKAKEVMGRMYLEASKILKLAEPVTGDATVGDSYLAVH